MKVSTEIDNNFGYEKITQLVDNIPLIFVILQPYVFTIHIFLPITNLFRIENHYCGHNTEGKKCELKKK